MKRKVFLSIVMMFCLSVSLLWADNSNTSKEQQQPIEITMGSSSTQPRQIVSIPIECYYYNGILFFMFNEDIGDINITVISNSHTWEKCITSSDGISNINISNGDKGIYTIEILSEYGEIFMGRFSLCS
jgi:hypothetical protein